MNWSVNFNTSQISMCWLSSSFLSPFDYILSPSSTDYIILSLPFLIICLSSFVSFFCPFYHSLFSSHICFSFFLSLVLTHPLVLPPFFHILSGSFFLLFSFPLPWFAFLSYSSHHFSLNRYFVSVFLLLRLSLSHCKWVNSDLRVNRNPSLSVSNFGWKVGVSERLEEERRAGLGGGVAERPQRGVPALLRGLDRVKEQKRRKKRSERGRERGRDGEWRDLHSSLGSGRQLSSGPLQRAQAAVLQKRRLLLAHQPGRTSGRHPREKRPQQ